MAQPQQRQTQSTQAPPATQSPPLPASQSPPLRPAQLLNSSHAKNSPTPEDHDDVDAPVHPNLSEDQMAILTSLLSQPGREQYTTVLSPNLEPGTTWFGYDKSRLTRKITKILPTNLMTHTTTGLVIELGRPMSSAEVFIRAHTKSDGSFVDYKAEKVVEPYKKNKEAKLLSLETDDAENSDGHHQVLSIEEDNELFLQSTFTNSRGHIFGLRSLKNQMKDMPHDPTLLCFHADELQLQDAQCQLQEQAALFAMSE